MQQATGNKTGQHGSRHHVKTNFSTMHEKRLFSGEKPIQFVVVGIVNHVDLVTKYSKGEIRIPLLFIEWHCLSKLYMKCACCGGEMTKEKESERTITLKCKDCGLSNSELKG
jgi:hypothetical protein